MKPYWERVNGRITKVFNLDQLVSVTKTTEGLELRFSNGETSKYAGEDLIAFWESIVPKKSL